MYSTTITTVKQAFDLYLNRLELDQTRADNASQRYNAVKRTIETALPGKTVLQIGSFARRTKIRPLDENSGLDVDAIVCFGDTHQYAYGSGGIGPQHALDMVWNALVSDGTYQKMRPSQSSPVVELVYWDGFKIELVPCFRNHTGEYPRPGGPACYTVGNAFGGWDPADYDYDAKVITGFNQSEVVRGLLVPSIKMMKAFFRHNNIPIKSFHTEVLCVLSTPAVVTALLQSSYPAQMQYILAAGLAQIAVLLDYPVQIPGSYSPPVSSGMQWYDIQNHKESLKTLSGVAWRICELGDTEKALELWRQLIGPPFPAV